MQHPKNHLANLILLASLPPFVVLVSCLLIWDVSVYLVVLVLLSMGTTIGSCVYISKRRDNYQLRTVANLLEALKQEDYHLRGEPNSGNETYDHIMLLINDLANVLSQRHVLGREQELLMAKIINQIDVAVLALDGRGHISLVNPAATHLVAKDVQTLEGKTLAELGLQNLLLEAGERRLLELQVGAERGHFYVHAESFIEEGEHRRLIFITDVERLLHEEERKAWQNLLRVLSHEMNNSLTPIASISDTLRRIINQQETSQAEHLLEGLNVISERAASLTTFVERYKQLTHLPKPQKQPFALATMLKRLFPLFPQCHIELRNDDDPQIHGDVSQLEQVFVNLLKNAQEAMDGAGHVQVQWQIRDKHIQIFIRDQGQGISNNENLFVPFYTTKKSGSGIGLALCRQIAFNHHGQIRLSNREDRPGAEVSMSLPLM